MATVPELVAIKGEAFTFYTPLTSQADTDIFQVNPTLAEDDVKISIDGGELANPDTLPDVEPDGSKQVRVQLTAEEMDGGYITVIFCDVAGDEWQDLFIAIKTEEAQEETIPTAAAIATAVWAAGTRTLTSFGTLVGDIWSYVTRTLTQSGAQVAATVSGSTISLKSYTTWTINLTGLGDVSDRTKLYFTAKRDLDRDVDSEAVLQVLASNPANEDADGLLYIDGAAGDSTKASITVTDEVTGAITVTVDELVTGIPARTVKYDVKKITTTTAVTLIEGTFRVGAPSTRTL